MELNRGRFFVIAGPCVIESLELCLRVGSHVKGVCDRLGLSYVFKASFDKANRSSNSTFRGPGLQDGLAILDSVKRELGVPVLTDIHESEQAAMSDAPRGSQAWNTISHRFFYRLRKVVKLLEPHRRGR